MNVADTFGFQEKGLGKKTHQLQSDSTAFLFLVKNKKRHFRSAQASWQQHLDVYNGHPSSLLGMCSSL